jgi:hypothetical protein
MMTTKILRGVAVLGLTALLIAPAAAYAETKVHSDLTGDVRQYSLDSGPSDTGTAVPDRTDGDIKSIRVSHLTRNLRITLSFRSLTPSGSPADHVFWIRSNTRARNVDISTGPGRWRGKRELTTLNDKAVGCRGFSHRIDYTYEKIVLVVPTSCLGNPRWVRVGAGTAFIGGGDYFADDARSSTVGENLVLGPRVHRG